MRITTAVRPSPDSVGAPPPRRGVILLVVLALLTLLALVGLSFVFYAHASQPGVATFLGEVADLTEDTVTLAPVLGHDLQRATHEDVDFRPHLAALDDLGDRAEGLRVRVAASRDRTTDPDLLRDHENLLADVEFYLDLVDHLRCLVEEIRRRQ